MSSTEAQTPVRAVFERLRGPAAVLLLAVNGFLLLVGLLSILTSSLDFSDALATSRGSFLGLSQALLPGIAVVLAAVVSPPKEKLVSLVATIAVAELGFSLLFGLVTNFAVFGASYSVGSSFVSFLEGLGWLVLVAGVGFFALQSLMATRGAGRPAAEQGGYGQGGYPGAQGAPYGEMPGQGGQGFGDTGARPAAPYGGQSGQYPGQPGQQDWPGQPQSGQPYPGQQGQPAQHEWPGQAQQNQPTQAWQTQPGWQGQQAGQPQPGQPQPGQQWPSQAPTSGQPAPFTPPSSGVPYGQQPSSGVPYGQQPSSGVPYGSQPGGAYPAQGYGSGYPQPAGGGYPGPGGPAAQETNVVNVNDLLPPDQGQHRPSRHGDDDR